MKKLFLLVCLGLSVSARCQTQPKVAFLTDSSFLGWSTSPSFTANTNWIAVPDIQTAISQHAAFLFIDDETDTVMFIGSSSHGTGDTWGQAATFLQQSIQQAQAAKLKVILGNMPVSDNNARGNLFNSWLQTYSVAQHIPVVNVSYWMQHGCYGVVATPVGGECTLASVTDASYNPDQLVPTALGYQFLTQMAQIAIATYGLTIKGGYLANVLTIPEGDAGSYPPNPGNTTAAQVNNVEAGSTIQFTPQATWSDGVTRPMLNSPYGEAQGIWRSTNPKIITVTQQGLAFAYSPLPVVYPPLTSAITQVFFQTSNGHTFSPWGMTVYQPEF